MNKFKLFFIVVLIFILSNLIIAFLWSFKTTIKFSNYTPLATEDFGENGGKQLLFRHATGYHYVWTLSETWEYQTGSLIPAEDSEATTELLSNFGL